MKKSKLIIALSSFAMAAAGLLAVGGLKAKKVEAVGAVDTSGSLICKLAENHNWKQSSAKLCACLTDDAHTVWTSLQTIGDTTLFKFDYTVSFTPTKLIWVRMNGSESAGSWDDGKKWNQTADLSFREATFIENGWDYPSTSQWTVSAEVRSSAVAEFGTKTTLSTIGINGSGNPEVSGSVTLAKDEEFKILSGDGVWTGFYGCPDAIDGCFSGGSKTSHNNENPEGNIVCDVAGTYDFFFDTELKKVWLTRNDIVAADGWARTFLDADCTATKSGWETSKTNFESLSAEAQNVLKTEAHVDYKTSLEGYIERAVQRYDYVLELYGVYDASTNPTGYKDFMGRVAAGKVVPGSRGSNVLFNTQVNNNHNTIIIISVVSLVSVSALGVLLVIKKRRATQ